tara:strand:+ start:1101 stop:1331 length:231 start_codon:yes stop_codon:yes gene_type:complete
MIENILVIGVGVGIICAETILIITMLDLNKNTKILIDEFTTLSEQMFKMQLQPKAPPKPKKKWWEFWKGGDKLAET